MMDGNGLDKLLMRIKDLILIGGTLFGIIVFLFRFQSIPDKVSEHDLKINQLNGINHTHELKIQAIGQDLQYIRDAVAEIKALIKRP